MDVLGIPSDWRNVGVYLAPGIDQIQRFVVNRLALITLVSTGIFVPALRTSPLDVSISEKGFMLFTVRLSRGLLDRKIFV